MASDIGVAGIEDGVAKIDFHHPFTPYDVQEQFMKTVYQVLEKGDGQIGILESPTGTVSKYLEVLMFLPSHVLGMHAHVKTLWRRLTKYQGKIAVTDLRVSYLVAQSQILGLSDCAGRCKVLV